MLDRSQLIIVRVTLTQPKKVFAAYYEQRSSRDMVFGIEFFPDSPDAILRLNRYTIHHPCSLNDVRISIFPASALIMGSPGKNIRLSDADRAWLELVAE